jgi:hypothetical protein
MDVKNESNHTQRVCIISFRRVSIKVFRKQLTVKLMDDAGIETSLRLGKQAKIRIGLRYRFYFKKGEHLSLGNEYFDTALSSDHFLGFEEFGELKDKSSEHTP